MSNNDRLFRAGVSPAGMVNEATALEGCDFKPVAGGSIPSVALSEKSKGDTMTTKNLTHLDTQRRRKIEVALRAIRQGGRSLALLAAAAEICIHKNDRDSAGELESVYRQIQALQAEADAIARELEN